MQINHYYINFTNQIILNFNLSVRKWTYFREGSEICDREERGKN